MPDVLERLKAARSGDPAVAAAYRALIERAKTVYATRPVYSVVDKRMIPPSGDRHDYLSVGPYWWPDPTKPDGVPYMRRDGVINPERSSNKYDLADLDAMSADVEVLSLAYYFTDDVRFAQRAARLLKLWFLEPQTRMNPNMNFAQAVPGREDGRAEGVIDTTRLQRVVEGIGLIGPANVLTADEQAGLEQWFGAYTDWMRKSRNGKAEDAAKNNHGMWYDAQMAHFSLFARRPDQARKVADAFPARRIATQMQADGRLPLELARTRSLHYSIYALLAAYDVAELGKCVGVDLFAQADAQGRGLRRGTEFVAAYRGKLESWPYKELRPDGNELEELLRRAARAWPEAGWTVAPEVALRRFMRAGGSSASEANDPDLPR